MDNEQQPNQQHDEAADGRSASDPPHDPKQHPAPPSNPDVDQEDVDRGRDKIDRIVGN